MLILITIICYFCFLFVFSRMRRNDTGNEAFFNARRRSPWYLVAFGMVGASVSATTFVSVPGMPMTQDMTYLQMCLGFIPGYFLVAYVLLPFYYRNGHTTIYQWLAERFGSRTHGTAAMLFVLSSMASAAIAFCAVCSFVGNALPWGNGDGGFALTALLLTFFIWLYTRRGGVATLVWTDTVQTFCMIAALVMLIGVAVYELGMTPAQALEAVVEDSRSHVFVFDDWMSKSNFFKQFISGIFIVVVMTGLDQRSMHKNLTCRTLADAQKNMCTYGFAFVPVNALFLMLGVLILLLAGKGGVELSAGDALLTTFCQNNSLASLTTVLFTLGIVSASFSTVDSALTALTTTCCADIVGNTTSISLRKKVHLVMCVAFALFVMLFHLLNNTSLIDAIYTICSYTYGPLLGIFTFGMFCQKRVSDTFVPYIAIASPLLCYALSMLSGTLWGYTFGYELLLVNAMFVVAGLLVIRR